MSNKIRNVHELVLGLFGVFSCGDLFFGGLKDFKISCGENISKKSSSDEYFTKFGLWKVCES